MRDAFANFMTDVALERKDICLLSGDIGNRMFDKFKDVAPERFFNCGIAEGSMMSVAAGMGLCGLRPFVYTITPFTTTRCLEQIRVGVAYHSSPVTIIGTGSGLSYSELGATHHSLEDIAIMRAIPDIRILAPSDSEELMAQLREVIDQDIPTYIRIGKKGEPRLHGESSTLGIGKGNLLKDGEDRVILGVGPILNEALEAAKIVEQDGKRAAVACLGSVRPLDTVFLEDLARRYKTWISIEEHGVVGGLGSALGEWLDDNGDSGVRLYKLGTPNKFIHELGSQHYARRMLGLDARSIATRLLKIPDRRD